jgi:hypothetical protein
MKSYIPLVAFNSRLTQQNYLANVPGWGGADFKTG